MGFIFTGMFHLTSLLKTMSMIMSLRSLRSNSIRSLNLLNSHRLLAGIRPSSPLEISASKHGWFYLDNQGIQSSISRLEVRRIKTHAAMGNDLLPEALPPPTSNFYGWATGIVGSIVSLTLALWKIKDQVETVEEEVADAVEIVEEVAEAVEKVSSEVGDKIQQDGVLKDAVAWVEKASKEVKEYARQTLDFFHKVDEIKEEVEKDLETLLEQQENDGQREGQDSNGGKEKGGEEIQGRKSKDGKETQEETQNEEGQGRKKNEDKEAQGRKERGKQG